MKEEIAAVVFFLKSLIKKAKKLEAEKVDLFVERLTVALQEKYKGHWYPDNPTKGQAFRCIRVNKFHKEDADLLRACTESGVPYRDLGLPKELTLWVDPGEVCCRYGENNFGFTVATFSSDDDDNKKDVTKKVTSAVERVTSDYQSESSDEDGGCRESQFTTYVPYSLSSYQQINGNAPLWHPLPRKKFGLWKGHIPPRPPHIIRPSCRPTSCSFKPHGEYPSKQEYLLYQLQ